MFSRPERGIMDRIEEEKLMTRLDGVDQRTKKMMEQIHENHEAVKEVSQLLHKLLADKTCEQVAKEAPTTQEVHSKKPPLLVLMYELTKKAKDPEIEKLKAENEALRKELQAFKNDKQFLERLQETVTRPHPCDGELYKNWSLEDYLCKTKEEHDEMVEAYIDWRFILHTSSIGHTPSKEVQKAYDHFMKECCDEIIAVTGLMDKAKCNAEQRAKYMNEVNQSNATRDGGRRFKK